MIILESVLVNEVTQISLLDDGIRNFASQEVATESQDPKPKRFTRTIIEFQNLVSSLHRRYPYLIIPAPPPLTNDIVLIGDSVSALLSYIEAAPELLESDEFTDFIHSEFIFNPVISPILGSATSFALSRNCKEIDVFFDQCRVETDNLTSFLSAIGRNSERIALQSRQSIAALEGTIKAIAGLALPPSVTTPMTATIPSTPTQRSTSLRKLLKYYESLNKIAEDDVNYRLATLNDSLICQLQATSITTAALDYRLGMLQEYEFACKSTQKKLISMEKLRSYKNIDQQRVDEVLEELTVLKRKEQECRDQFKERSERLKKEYKLADERRELEIGLILDGYVANQINALDCSL